MVDFKRLGGAWRGRLVDLQGFEGEILMTLQAVDEAAVGGTFSVSIGSTHASLVQRGEVKGTVRDSVVMFAFQLRDPPVKVVWRATAQDLRDGGVALSGTYDVSAKTFSPLQGGAISVSKDRADADRVMSIEKAG